jgi:predicted PurR-regulated permease PerM
MPARRTASISISTGTIVKVAAFVLGLWVIWFLRDVFALLIAALLLAALIEPFADWMHERHMPRTLAVLIVYAFLVAIAGAVVFLLLPVLFEQARGFAVSASSASGSFFNSYDRLHAFSARLGLEQSFQSTVASFQASVADSVASVFSTVKGILGGIAALFVVFVLAFYMVAEEDAARRSFKSLAPKKYQPRIVAVLRKVETKIGAWLRGQIVLGLIVGSAAYLGLLFLGVPYALLLGIIAGLLEAIPYLGPIVSVVPAAILGFSVSPLTGGMVLVLYLIIQQLENNLLVPKIMQRATGLNPLVIIVSLIVGAKLGGLAGVVLAIPVAIIVTVILEDSLDRASAH